MAAGERLAPWRAAVVAFRQEIDGDGLQLGRPAVLVVYGTAPDDWLAAVQSGA